MSVLNYERRGTGEPLLLIHGVGGSWRNFEPVLVALAAERDVVAIDLPGFGQSPPFAAGIAPTPALMAERVAELLDELGIERARIGGHSMGGWIALELAARGRASDVVALAPAGIWQRRRDAAFTTEPLRAIAFAGRPFGRALPRIAGTLPGRSVLLGSNSVAPWRIPGKAASRIIADAVGAPGFTPTLTAMRRERFQRWSEVTVPVTFVWGEQERVIRRARTQPLAEACLPRSRTVVLESSGHMMMWDRPKATIRLLLDPDDPQATIE